MTSETEGTRESFIPSIGASNDYGQATAITMRLDTRPLLDDIELWLRGSRILVNTDEDNNLKYEKVDFGTPKANDIGVQSILSMVSSVFNSQFVQGNWKEDRYEDFIFEFHDSLLWNTWINLYDWGVAEDDYEVVVDHIMHCMIGFASRLIGNKERESYAPTMRSVETMHTKESGGGSIASLFSKK